MYSGFDLRRAFSGGTRRARLQHGCFAVCARPCGTVNGQKSGASRGASQFLRVNRDDRL